MIPFGLCTLTSSFAIVSQLFQRARTTELRGHSLKLYKKKISRCEKVFFQPKNCRLLERITRWHSNCSHHFQFQKQTRHLDGQIWTLKAYESLTSPSFCNCNCNCQRIPLKHSNKVSYIYCSDFQEISCYTVWMHHAIDAANNRLNNCNNRRGDRLQR